eukprot:COSAG03_NODE_1418_length_4106_cov_12.520339_3_plen_73_part_00
MSLSRYIKEITSQLTQLNKRVDDLERENKELKDILTTSNHRWWMNATQKQTTDDYVEDLIKMSNQPDYLKYR